MMYLSDKNQFFNNQIPLKNQNTQIFNIQDKWSQVRFMVSIWILGRISIILSELGEFRQYLW